MREFARYVTLNVLGMLGISGYILADTFFVANALGGDGLAALNLAIPVYNFIHGAGLCLGIGGAARFTVLCSRGEAREGRTVFTHALGLALGLGTAGMVLGALGADAISRALGADGAVGEMSRTYLQLLLLFSPLFLTNEVTLAFVRNDGAPQLAMAAMVGGSLANVVLDYVFIYPLQLGILGAVVATGIAPVVSLLILSPHLRGGSCRFLPCQCRFSGALCRRIAALGDYSLVTESSGGVVMMVCNGLILSLMGTVGVAAYGVVANIALVVTAISTGIAQGIQPLVSRRHGLGQTEESRRTLRRGVWCALAVNGAIYGVMLLFAGSVAAAFNGDGDALLQAEAVRGLRLYFAGAPFAAVSIVAAAWLAAAGRAVASGVISLLRGFGVVLPLLVLLSRWGGMTGLWLAVPVTEAVVCAAALVLLRRD